MFGRPKNELTPPPIAKYKNTVEVLRVWADPAGPQQLALEPYWKDPACWGLMLADIARHAAKAYRARGASESASFERIVEAFRAEIEDPTDTPQQIS